MRGERWGVNGCAMCNGMPGFVPLLCGLRADNESVPMGNKKKTGRKKRKKKRKKERRKKRGKGTGPEGELNPTGKRACAFNSQIIPNWLLD